MNLTALAAQLGFEKILKGPFDLIVNSLTAKVFIYGGIAGKNLIDKNVAEMDAAGQDDRILAVLAAWTEAKVNNINLILKGDIVDQSGNVVEKNITVEAEVGTQILSVGISSARMSFTIDGETSDTFSEYPKCHKSPLALALKNFLSGKFATSGIMFGDIPYIGVHSRTKFGQKVIPIDSFDNVSANNNHGYNRFKLADRKMNFTGKKPCSRMIEGNEAIILGFAPTQKVQETKYGIQIALLTDSSSNAINKEARRG